MFEIHEKENGDSRKFYENFRHTYLNEISG